MTKMPVKKAIEIAEAIASAYKKWGKHASVNYTQEQLYEAIGTLFENGNIDATPKEDVTKLRRQLAVCLNRELRRKAGTVFSNEAGNADADESVT